MPRWPGKKKAAKAAPAPEIDQEMRSKWLEIRMDWTQWTFGGGKPVTSEFGAERLGYANTDQAKIDPVYAAELEAMRGQTNVTLVRDRTPVTKDQLQAWDPIIDRRRDQAANGEEQFDPMKEAEQRFCPPGFVAKFFNADYIGRDGGPGVAMEGYQVAKMPGGEEVRVRDCVMGILPREVWEQRKAAHDRRIELKYGNLDGEALEEDRKRAARAEGRYDPLEPVDPRDRPDDSVDDLESEKFDEGPDTYGERE